MLIIADYCRGGHRRRCLEPVLTPDLTCVRRLDLCPLLLVCVYHSIYEYVRVNASRVRAASPVAVAACAKPCIFRCHPPPGGTRGLCHLGLISLLSALWCLVSPGETLCTRLCTLWRGRLSLDSRPLVHNVRNAPCVVGSMGPRERVTFSKRDGGQDKRWGRGRAPGEGNAARSRRCGRSVLVCDDQLGHAVDHLERLALGRVEAALGHALDDARGAEAQPVGVDGHVLQRPERAEPRPVERVVDHEVVHQQPAAGLERLVRVLVQGSDDRLGHLPARRQRK
eukprot:scaffold37247_cov56-Phaeocystis_antarctica.AAC.1